MLTSLLQESQGLITYAFVMLLLAMKQGSQGLITYAFVMLLLAMISLHMLTFRLMVTMVAERSSFHNTLLGEITISSTRTTRVSSIPYPVMIPFHMQRFKIIGFTVIKVRFFKRRT